MLSPTSLLIEGDEGDFYHEGHEEHKGLGFKIGDCRLQIAKTSRT